MSRELRRLLLLLVVLGVIAWRLATAAEEAFLPPPRPGLEAIPLPDLATLEEVVQRQLEDLQAVAEQAIAREGAASASLAAAYGTLGEAYHAYELLPAARACYLNARTLQPGDLRWLHLLARLEEKVGRLETALLLYGDVRRLSPGYVAAPVREAEILMQLDRAAEARASLTAAAALAPASTAVLAGLGRLALAGENHELAVDYLEKALVQQPAADRLHYSLAMAYRGLGRMEEARRHLARSGSVGVVASDPIFEGLQQYLKGERVHLLRGRLAFNAGRPQDAAAEFQQAVLAAPTSARARVNLATSLAALGDREQALQEFQAVLELDASQSTAHYNLGLLLAEKGDHDDAVPHLRRAADAEVTDLDARRLLATSLLALGRGEEAVVPMLQIEQQNPGDEGNVLRLAELLSRLGRHREAHERLEAANGMFPSRGLTAHALARVLAASPDLSVRDGERALDLGQRVLHMRRSVEHGETVALALAELGRCSEAAALLRQLLTAARELGADAEVNEGLQARLEHISAGPPCRP